MDNKEYLSTERAASWREALRKAKPNKERIAISRVKMNELAPDYRITCNEEVNQGLTREQALRMSASFGAGIGRMRLTCGAVCGMLQLAGLEHCALEGNDRKAKSENYALVQRLADEFRRRNGSITCRELLGLRKEQRSAEASERTPEYYATRPCARMIESAARIWVEHLEGRLPDDPRP